MKRIAIVDSHTGGEPTRVVVDGAPFLGRGTTQEKLAILREQHDAFRGAVVNEPRGSDVLVGAMLVEPADETCAAGVIFFNNVGYLGMCGHGAIGVVKTLAHLKRIEAGAHRLETPVGVVTATLHPDGRVTIANVPSWRARQDVKVTLANGSVITGDVAWGGNWFFLVHYQGGEISKGRAGELTEYAWSIRQAVNQQGFPEVDHVELFAPSVGSSAHSRNFVLCPGRAYDRSPCGTGTSAKLACLAADGKLAPGAEWVQEGILGSTFSGRYQWLDRNLGHIGPSITGTAYVNAEATLLVDEGDPFAWGIRDFE